MEGASTYGRIVILLVILTFSQCSEAIQPLQLYHQLPHLHAGVVRDFEELQFQYNRQENYELSNIDEINSDRSSSSIETTSFEIRNIPPERSLQNGLSICYDALYLADQNQDDKVDGDEFVTFAQIMGPLGFLPNSDTYEELPLILQSNFIILACLCLQIPNFDGGMGIDPKCCAVDPHIDISGTHPGEIPNAQQSQYLYQVCFLTETSIDRLLLSAAPTPEPSKQPSVVVTTDTPTNVPRPTNEPTEKLILEPSVSPTFEETNEPTIKPTEEPTNVPTHEPTYEPTYEPSYNPTVEPTRVPSSEPSRNPTVEPTDRPSDVPTNQPTDEPTSEPSPKLSRSPTVEPTDKSTNVSTNQPTAEPTMEPSHGPSDEPTLNPTFTPTIRPSMRPSLEGDNVSSFPVPTIQPLSPTEDAIVTYGIAIINGNVEDIPSSSFIPDLIESMGIVAEEIASSMNVFEQEDNSRGLQREKHEVVVMNRSLGSNQRKLATVVDVNLPTTIESLAEAECPLFFSSSDDCKTVTALVELSFTFVEDVALMGRQTATQGVTDPTLVKLQFTENLNTAIRDGELQAALIKVNPNSVVTITTGFVPTTVSPTSTPSELLSQMPTGESVPISTGGIAGIVLAGVAGGLIIGLIVIGALRRQESKSGGDNLIEQAEIDVEEARLKQDTPDLGSGDVDKANDFLDQSDDFVKGTEPDQSPTVSEKVAGTGVAALAAAAVVATTASPRISSSELETEPGASGASSSKKKRPPNALYEVHGAKPIVVDDASSAGESGWSSNQDGSSANTSIDNSLDSIPQSNFSGISPVVLGGAVEGETQNEMVDQGSSSSSTPAKSQPSLGQEQSSSLSQGASPATSRSPQSQALSQDMSYSGTTGTEGSVQSTYSELDEAIQKGDWAAVGVTAALLASQAYVDENTQGSSKQNSLRARKQSTALNPERAAELDRLVENGDWEGVVAAAAKFDAQEALRGDAHSSQNSESASVVDSTGGSNTSSALSGSGGGSSIGTAPSNMSGSQTIDTTTSPSTYTATGLTATSDTASTRSKARKLNEIRDEVEALVTAVVPEEADNVDEMMTQFRGREEELVETLRSMQERQVAQKARKESQKQAKRQAKEYIQDKKKQEFEAVDNIGDTADDIWMKELEEFDASQVKVMKDQLKEAISNENWERVAEAATSLSGYTFPKGQDQRSSRDNESTVSNRSVDINVLVDQGDWDGVVAAAGRYAESSTNASSTNDYTRENTEELPDDSTIEERRKRREERLREEEEALAQAEIWDAIADQTKVENSEEERGSSGNAGAAKMAADWAIDQSLAALKKAEEDHDNDSEDSVSDKKEDNESL